MSRKCAGRLSPTSIRDWCRRTQHLGDWHLHHPIGGGTCAAEHCWPALCHTHMKAIRIYTYGGPDVLVYEEAPRPTPAAGEVLLQVYSTSLNPVDRYVRAGLMH